MSRAGRSSGLGYVPSECGPPGRYGVTRTGRRSQQALITIGIKSAERRAPDHRLLELERARSSSVASSIVFHRPAHGAAKSARLVSVDLTTKGSSHLPGDRATSSAQSSGSPAGIGLAASIGKARSWGLLLASTFHVELSQTRLALRAPANSNDARRLRPGAGVSQQSCPIGSAEHRASRAPLSQARARALTGGVVHRVSSMGARRGEICPTRID